MRCTATTKENKRCRKNAIDGSTCCTIHSIKHTKNNCTHVLNNGKTCSKQEYKDGKCHLHYRYENDCPICLEPIYKNQIKTLKSCGHYFHYVCVDRWLEKNDKCPMCRTIDPETQEKNNRYARRSLLPAFNQMMHNDPDSVLIFYFADNAYIWGEV